jgi:endonuclease/exonuclease/phosphatase family metal-dependent hydrolase
MRGFSLLTFNCYGVPGIGTSARLKRIADRVNEADYTVVCLQEVQSHRYRRLFQKACEQCYPSHAYHHFVHAPKGGLLTLSKAPLDDREFVLFKDRGLWYTPALADWILHKGVLITAMVIEGLPVLVLNTHLTANYFGDWSQGSPFAMQEHSELTQIADIVNAQASNALVIVAGDFNIPRGSWLYHALLDRAGLIDPMAGDTRPTFRPKPGMGARYAAAIDYTLYRPPDGVQIHVRSDLQFRDKVTIKGSNPQYLSDHLAVETHFSWEI